MRSLLLLRAAPAYARLALGAALLSGVAIRFGLRRRDGGDGTFEAFEQDTAEVNAFAPRGWIPFLAWSATLAELLLGVALVLGLSLRLTALACAALLLTFGLARALSLGIKSSLDDSVFSASAAALLLATRDGSGTP